MYLLVCVYLNIFIVINNIDKLSVSKIDEHVGASAVFITVTRVSKTEKLERLQTDN